MDRPTKRQLVKVFTLEGQWVPKEVGVLRFSVQNENVHIEITNDKNVKIINAQLSEEDVFYKQDERVVQVQGPHLDQEYAFSFIDKALCQSLCDTLKKVGVQQAPDEDKLGLVRAWRL